MASTIIRDRVTRGGTFAIGVRVTHAYVTTDGEPDRVRLTVTYPHGHYRAGQIIRERWAIVPDGVTN